MSENGACTHRPTAGVHGTAEDAMVDAVGYDLYAEVFRPVMEKKWASSPAVLDAWAVACIIYRAKPPPT